MFGGSLAGSVYLRELPEGLVFTLENSDAHDTDTWYTAISYGSKKPPYTVNAGRGENSLISNALISSTSIWSRGTGPTLTLRFSIKGNTNGRYIEKGGYMTFSGTEWPWSGRPDYLMLLFSFDGEQAMQISMKTPFMIRPDPFYLGIGIKDEKLLIIASIEDNLTTDIISNVISGIFTAHTKAISWVFGKII